MRPFRIVCFGLILLLCTFRTTYAATFNFDFAATKADMGSLLKAGGTFSVSGSQYTDATGTVYTDVNGTFVGATITGIDTTFSPPYDPANIVFAFDADNGATYFINGPPSAMLSDSSDNIVEGTFTVTSAMSVPLPSALPLFGLAVLGLGFGRLRSRNRSGSATAEGLRGET